jgi:hypothetical protein
MITQVGKNILAKYMIGHAPSYASYISFGCGAMPKGQADDLADEDYSEKTSMDFEMFRSPIISRGYVTENVTDENGVVQLDDVTGKPLQYSEIVFTAQLPTDERYEITEVGVWSAGSNPSVSANDSKVLFAFTESENWEYHTDTSSLPVEKINTALDEENEENTLEVAPLVFEADSDNTFFDNQIRYGRNERPRFLNNSLFIRGDASTVTKSGEVISASGPHIHINGVSVNLDKNPGSDEIKVAFSLINKEADSSNPTDVRMILELSPPETSESTEFARFKIDLSSVDGDFNNNRYFVVTKRLDEIEKSQEFSWQAASVIKIYSSVIVDGQPSPDYYVALDGIRLENVSSKNPLYGMVGYTVTKTTDGLPIIKNANTTNMLEFRFGMDVQ